MKKITIEQCENGFFVSNSQTGPSPMSATEYETTNKLVFLDIDDMFNNIRVMFGMQPPIEKPKSLDIDRVYDTAEAREALGPMTEDEEYCMRQTPPGHIGGRYTPERLAAVREHIVKFRRGGRPRTEPSVETQAETVPR